MRDKVIGKINVSYEGLISSRATGETARNGRCQDDSSRSGITPGLIEFISLDDDPSGISDVQAIRKHPVSAAGQATMTKPRPDRNCRRNRPSATVNIHMVESNVTAILGECLSCRIWSENYQRLPLPSASVGCRDFTIMPNIMVRSRLRENRRCVSGRTFDGVHMRSSLLCQSVRSGRDCEHRSNDSSFSGPGLRVSEPLRT